MVKVPKIPKMVKVRKRLSSVDGLTAAVFLLSLTVCYIGLNMPRHTDKHFKLILNIMMFVFSGLSIWHGLKVFGVL